MKKRSLIFLVVFVIGGAGGVVFERTLIPWMVSHDAFRKIPRLTMERTTVVQPKEEIIIDRAEALERAISAVRPALLRIEHRNARGAAIASVSGVALTSDGVVATSGSILSASGDLVVVRNGDTFPATVLASDAESGAALLRIAATGLPVLSFVEDVLPLGASVFLLTAGVDERGATKAELDVGYVTAEGPDASVTNLSLGDPSSSGAPVFTIEGKLVGIAAEGSLVPAVVIRDFLERT